MYAKHCFNYELTLKRAKTVKDSNLVWVHYEMTGQCTTDSIYTGSTYLSATKMTNTGPFLWN